MPRIQIKNVKLAILALLLFIFFISLGFWQLARAKQKIILLKTFNARTAQAPLKASDFQSFTDLRFHQATLTGTFDNQHTFLLDNKIFHGQVGYEVLTPFIVPGMATPILVDRGFVPMGAERQTLPAIHAIDQKITITGLLNTPPRYVTLGAMQETKQTRWPLRIEYIHLPELANLLNKRLFPYLLTLKPHQPGAYAIEWQILSMGPEKHQGYAVQWFALALTLLILFVTLNVRLTRALRRS